MCKGKEQVKPPACSRTKGGEEREEGKDISDKTS